MVQTRSMKWGWAQRNLELREQALTNRIREDFKTLLSNIQRVPPELRRCFWDDWLDAVFATRATPSREPEHSLFFMDHLDRISMEKTVDSIGYHSAVQHEEQVHGARFTTTENVKIDMRALYILANPSKDDAFRAILDIQPMFEGLPELWGELLQTVCNRYKLYFTDPDQLQEFYQSIADLEARDSLPSGGISFRFAIDTFASKSLRKDVGRLNYMQSDTTFRRTSHEQLTRWLAALNTIQTPFYLELIVSGPILDLDHLKDTISPHMKRAKTANLIIEQAYPTRDLVHWLMFLDPAVEDDHIFPEARSPLAEPSTQYHFAFGVELERNFTTQLNREIRRINLELAVFREVEHMEEA